MELKEHISQAKKEVEVQLVAKITAWLVLSFLAGLMLAHARYQPIFNELGRIEAKIEAYRQSAVVGYWRFDRVSTRLYFEGR